MAGSLVVTVFPVVFLVLLFGGGTLMRRRNIDIDGEPPIGKGIFYASKYAILGLWGVTVAQSWGLNLSFMKAPEWLWWVFVALWVGGFLLLIVGILGTLNPIVLLAGVFVIAVHHRIVLAEEQHLQKAFGQEYRDYCGRVRRYL
jgi:protein-S-isoprenylcysteine O-methyltransferase Ste14